MNRFEVIQPSVWLAPYVKQYWFLTLQNIGQGSQRLIPFNSIVITFNRIQSARDGLVNDAAPCSHVFGQTNQYTDFNYSGMADFVSVVFTPEGANAFFGRPMSELFNQHVPLDCMEDKSLIELEKQLTETTSTTSSVQLIESLLTKRIIQCKYNNYKRLQSITKAIDKGESNLLQLADTACLGYKQFKRIFTEHIGINPKEFVKINRFQKTITALQTVSNMSLMQIAEKYGYYDKSHLIKELREYTGFTPNEFRQTCNEEYSQYHSLFRSAFVDLPT